MSNKHLRLIISFIVSIIINLFIVSISLPLMAKATTKQKKVIEIELLKPPIKKIKPKLKPKKIKPKLKPKKKIIKKRKIRKRRKPKIKKAFKIKKKYRPKNLVFRTPSRPADLRGGTKKKGPGVTTGVGNSGGTLGTRGKGGWKTGIHDKKGDRKDQGDDVNEKPPFEKKPKILKPPIKKTVKKKPPKPKEPTRGARVVNWWQPPYPGRARLEESEGTVVLRVSLNSSGHVIGINIIQSSGDRRLDRAARREAWKFSYSPRLERGVAVSSSVNVSVNFRLNN